MVFVKIMGCRGGISIQILKVAGDLKQAIMYFGLAGITHWAEITPPKT